LYSTRSLTAISLKPFIHQLSPSLKSKFLLFYDGGVTKMNSIQPDETWQYDQNFEKL